MQYFVLQTHYFFRIPDFSHSTQGLRNVTDTLASTSETDEGLPHSSETGCEMDTVDYHSHVISDEI